MCGIAGWLEAAGEVDQDVLRRMTDALEHRGPDDAGHILVATRLAAAWDAGRGGERPDGHWDLGLGHRRLSILDTSPRGRQPMATRDGRFWIVHNGEVYNYVELRSELGALGHSFSTETDTEVILAAYAQWGVDCLQHFNGMFAFAIWDGVERRLFCARDRFGIKPFYYWSDGHRFVFASEIKALLRHPAINAAPDDEIIHDYLALGLVDHTPQTFFAGIRRLPAAHMVVVDAQAGLHGPRRWWEMPIGDRMGCGDEERLRLVDEFRDLLEDSIRIRLRSDVPVGTCLSGGLDSSSIVAMANRLMFDRDVIDPRLVGERQRTFSACFEDPRFDESEFVDRVVGATGTANWKVYPSAEDLWSDAGEMVRYMDEPFQSTSQYSQWKVMQLVRSRSVTVTLDGQGADELLAGYPGYHAVLVASLLRRARLLSAAAETRAMFRFGDRGRRPAELLPRAAYGLMPPGIGALAREMMARRGRGAGKDGAALAVLQPDLAASFRERRRAMVAEQASLTHALNRRLHADVFRFSLPALLRYEDRNSMAFSIEARTPFLDYRLAELVASMPAGMKISRGWTKWVLRKAMHQSLPDEVTWRTDKKGFVTPEVLWLRAAKDRIGKLFDGAPSTAGYLASRAVARHLDGIVKGNEHRFYTEAWRWVNLELWMREFFRAGA